MWLRLSLLITSLCQGLIGAAVFVENPLSLSEFPESEGEVDGIVRWELVTPEIPKRHLVSVKLQNLTLRQQADPSTRDSMEVNSMNQPISMIRQTHSSILLVGYQPKNQDVVRWYFLNSKTRKTILHFTTSVIHVNPFYRQRSEFDVVTGSLLLRNLQTQDSGIFEVILNPIESQGLEKGDQISYVELDVQEQLASPLIIQNHAKLMNPVELRCIVKIGKARSIQWEKNKQKIFESKHLKMEYDSSTLFIEKMTISDCGTYTCIVTNNVSSSANSFFLTADGILFLHEDAVVSSVVSLVSTLISISATAFVLFAMERYQVKQYWLQVTAVMLIFHTLSFLCHILAFVIFLLDEGFNLGYKVSAGIGCVQCLAVTCYVVTLFLRRQTEQSPFLANIYKGAIFLGCELLSVLTDTPLIIHSKQNPFKEKRSHLHLKAVKRVRESKLDEE
ncbi:uncharacterized protein [Scyliorhinus torazame]|uniref:uncharacterized protein isoform X2 n=1 Tax=Scyliorhinus torazame TaxID=75743 RepID=UPI003B5AD0D4